MDVLNALGPPTPSLTPTTDSRALTARTPDGETLAQGFESIFASLIIKQMRQTLEPDTMFGQDSGDVLGGMFDLFLGQHLAKSGALGIGRMVEHHLPNSSTNHERTDANRPRR